MVDNVVVGVDDYDAGRDAPELAKQPGVLDAALAVLGGSVTRRASRDVYAELQGR